MHIATHTVVWIYNVPNANLRIVRLFWTFERWSARTLKPLVTGEVRNISVAPVMAMGFLLGRNWTWKSVRESESLWSVPDSDGWKTFSITAGSASWYAVVYVSKVGFSDRLMDAWVSLMYVQSEGSDTTEELLQHKCLKQRILLMTERSVDTTYLSLVCMESSEVWSSYNEHQNLQRVPVSSSVQTSPIHGHCILTTGFKASADDVLLWWPTPY